MSRIIWLESSPSTSQEVNCREMDNFDVVAAREQTAGRGQRGNKWEAEPGKNLSFSMVYYPAQLPASRQFEVSMACATAIAQWLESHEKLCGRVKVKWPNDIYVDDMKICGILIENSVSGGNISRSSLGVGININQKEFRSDAPNPVSLAMLTGMEYDLEKSMLEVSQILQLRLKEIDSHDYESRKTEFFCRLWRYPGFYPYKITATGEDFLASIEDVLPDGTLVLQTDDRRRLGFQFKEVKSLIGKHVL